MANKLVRKLIGATGIATSLFIFQACYGTGQDQLPDVLIEGKVCSKETDKPIENIKVTVYDDVDSQYTYSDTTGHFQFYVYSYLDSITLHFSDIDGEEKGMFKSTDTVVKNLNEFEKLEIKLESE